MRLISPKEKGKKMLTINSPLIVGNRLTLKNRVVVPPMASGTADAEGFVTKKTLSHYDNLAKSKASLVMVEYTYVSFSGKSEEQQLGLTGYAHLPGLRKLASTIKESGSLSAIQLTHAGAKSETNITQGPLLSPSGLRVPVKGKELELPIEATFKDIEDIKESFVKAAVLASDAGFDVVEFHAAHGYGLNQWLSPITNQRSDLYGGNLLNRARLLLEIIKEVKTLKPDIILSVRMPGMDHFEGGLTNQDSAELAIILEKSGVHLLNISSGIGGWRRPDSRLGEGYLVDDAALVQKEVSIPVIGVGGIETANYIESILNRGKVSLAAVGRAILSNPQLWGETNFN
jgi:NADPH2 dehydrogenase